MQARGLPPSRTRIPHRATNVSRSHWLLAVKFVQKVYERINCAVRHAKLTARPQARARNPPPTSTLRQPQAR
jgi:hypothetical protein